MDSSCGMAVCRSAAYAAAAGRYDASTIAARFLDMHPPHDSNDAQPNTDTLPAHSRTGDEPAASEVECRRLRNGHQALLRILLWRKGFAFGTDDFLHGGLI